MSALAPLPLLVVELRRRGGVEEPVFTAVVHPPGSFCPPLSRPPNGFEDDATRRCAELDFL